MSVFQPTAVAACLTMLPSSVHSVLPHGMKSTVRPVGMGLVTFTVSVMVVGCCISLATMACALARPAWSAALRPLPEAELEVEDAVPDPLELLELQAASDRAAATASSTPARRNLKEKRLRVSSRAFIYPPSGTLVITGLH